VGAAPKVKEYLKFGLSVVKGPHAGTKLSFTKGAVTIGRGPENDVVLANDPRVSRQHAEIKQRDSDFIVVNLSEKNFVLLNGQNVQSEILVKGAVLVIGDSEIKFDYEAPATVVPPPPQVQVQPRAVLASVPPPAPPMPSFQNAAPAAPYQPQRPVGQAYQQGPQPGMGARPRPAPSSGNDSRLRFYGIIGVLVLAGWFLFSPSKKGAIKDPNAIRTSVITLQETGEADKRSQELLTIKKEKYDTVQYRRAHENFIRGFRDFQQGQYARARESFQVVLNLDPENELAKRYYHLSQIKFDELVKFNMIQGNRYREKRNWRMCQSNYSNVMTMLQNRRDDPTYKEAKQFFEE
jgi:pSer/pThr/pTyr-binding forkhead associated (FHA) protein